MEGLANTIIVTDALTVIGQLEQWVQSHEPHGLARWSLESKRTGMVQDGYKCELGWYGLKDAARPNFRTITGHGKTVEEAVAAAFAKAGYKLQEVP